ncbi:hypothetical protein CK203_021870 [Vitis vinifera]|uniref:Retrotransposon gag domain-containing protein n=1 Tax=Vitis vinifera TaxID=29760 RepID=A0A438JFT2_VITVI|nr:hypothetical protein CK203_021870 [Vitis vinifera]
MHESSGGERHFDVDWSPIIEDLYSPELEGCVPLEGMIASAKDLLKSTHIHLEPPSPCRVEEETFRIDFVHSLDTPSWVRVEGRLVRYSERQSMDQQGRPPAVAQDETPHDSLPPPPPPPIPSAPQASPYILYGHSEIAPPVVAQATVIDDTHARMDRIEQCMRQMRVSDGSVVWDDFEGMPVASLPAKFRMPDIERYTGIGCPRLHLRLYSTVMRAHGLDESQMITLFPLSLSGAAQRWFVSLESSRRRTWGDLAGKIGRVGFFVHFPLAREDCQIIDRPSERDQIQMVLRSLQPRIAKHVVEVPFADFGSLVMALYDVEDGISRGLWTDSSPSDIKGKKPFVGPRPDVSAIGHGTSPADDQTYMPQHWFYLLVPLRALRDPRFLHGHGAAMLRCSVHPRPAVLIPQPGAQQVLYSFALRTETVSQIGMPLSQALRKLTEAGLLIALTPRPPP